MKIIRLRNKTNEFKSDIPIEVIRFVLNYDSQTGVLRWRVSTAGTANAGNVAGGRDGRGYQSIKLFGRKYYAHRLAWVIICGEWPSKIIDHINGDILDNRWCNLREVDYSQNMINACLHSNNKSGFKGMSFNARKQKWAAFISAKKKGTFLGYFDKAEQAAEAYRSAAINIHGEFARNGG